MKNAIMMFVALMFSQAFLADQPAYLKDAVITVTLTDGKTYTYSANEYMVVKRGAKKAEKQVEETQKENKEVAAQPVPTKDDKNIISIGIVRSQRGFNTAMNGSTVDVETKKELGASVQYQRQIKDGLYLGGQIDSNGGAGVSLGKGF